MWQLRKHRPKDPETAHDQLVIDYQTTFGSETGRRVLWDIMDKCSVFACNNVAPAGGVAEVVLFNEGRRSIGIAILEKLEVENLEQLQEFAET